MSHAHGFASLSAAPHYAVIFSSQRNGLDSAGYDAAAARLFDLVQEQPGFLGAESARDAEGFGITVAYFTDEAAIAAWRDHAEHRAARQHGRGHWYAGFQLRIARVERAYGGRPADAAPAAAAKDDA
ncbi:antibiotic biosynthesis monooxygenase [Luteimonas sp. RD2P54]|uniref:Antibiotic biosynthesis monooxygenase n=1 Tax=Luteimonas endophytica TaxID=3042023 RepID=A0ABT6J931_9GAMM|nr:antibiotic biosynthesis monooxygenase [Luteimonas endophytica]MDH5823115.1 antibiotic biosynthesis monooxygenase [Luteimonas endophytica]